MACSKLDDFKTEFGAILMLKSISPNEHMQKLMDCGRKHHKIYTIDKVHCKYLIPHKANRGGLLLSPFNVHRNAAGINAVGADVKQLGNAVCMELAHTGPLREEHLKKNMELNKRAACLLADLNGSERYLTLGCGHTAAFCKHAALRGRTNQPTLQELGKTTIDLQRLTANKNFQQMITEGWSWECVSSEVDQMFLAFARIGELLYIDVRCLAP